MVNHGFELLQETDIPELNTKARHFRHQKTGAELLSLENQDENKVFGITFRTPPNDSTGIAHIMEHAVLCGSRKFPLKEPFVELVKGSLNTFLNAFTYPDRTCYPVASQNLKDFYNLIDVYVDAVFYPLIPKHTLQQEGWHYELESLDAPMVYKGVVFNEMKGAYSDPDNVLDRWTRQSLFPDNCYAVDSGGDPLTIPDLSYEQFKAFHEKYYHPSNARIFFYGDDDPDQRLQLMDKYLQDFSSIPVDSSVALQPRLEEPKRMIVSFDPGEEEENRKGQLVVNWLLAETGNPETMLALTILAHILIGTSASPLRKALIDSGLGEDITGVGLEGELLQSFFSTGLKGLKVSSDNSLVDGDQVETLITSTLESLANDGIDQNTVAASLNTVEFVLRENNTGYFPRGLVLMLRSLVTWLYDDNPLTPLAFEDPLNRIKEKGESGERYFEGYIQEYLLDNNHRTIVILQPEPGLNQRVDSEERAKLASFKEKMNQVELERVLEDTRRLKEIQETPDTPETLATIPSLELEDLGKENKLIPIDISDQNGCKILYHDLLTNGIVYLDVGFDLHALPQELIPYVPLFGRSLLEIGTKDEDFVKLSQRIGRDTGGIGLVSLNSSLKDRKQSAAWLFLRAKATMDNTGKLLDILQDILLNVNLDNRDRFHQMLLEEKAGHESMLVPAGHRVINTRLHAKFNEAGWVEELMTGIDYLFFLRELIQTVESDWQAVLDKLETLRNMWLNRNAMVCNITLDQDNWTQLQPQLAGFIETIPAKTLEITEWEPEFSSHSEGLIIPAQVNYVGKAANLIELGYEPHGSVSVITKYLRTTWIWERIRVLGGAYGGFCLFNRRSGVFSYLSYRDPNLVSTLENYDGTPKFLRNLDLSADELRKSIIGAIGDMDLYQLPDAKGYTSMTRYLVGENDEERQIWRDQILNTRLDDFHAFGDVLQGIRETSPVVVLGSQEAIQGANKARKGWLEEYRIL